MPLLFSVGSRRRALKLNSLCSTLKRYTTRVKLPSANILDNDVLRHGR